MAKTSTSKKRYCSTAQPSYRTRSSTDPSEAQRSSFEGCACPDWCCYWLCDALLWPHKLYHVSSCADRRLRHPPAAPPSSFGESLLQSSPFLCCSCLSVSSATIHLVGCRRGQERLTTALTVVEAECEINLELIGNVPYGSATRKSRRRVVELLLLAYSHHIPYRPAGWGRMHVESKSPGSWGTFLILSSVPLTS